MLVRPSKWLKQIIQIKDNRVKNPIWAEANQLAIHKRDRGSEIWTTMNNSSPNNKTRNLESEQGTIAISVTAQSIHNASGKPTFTPTNTTPQKKDSGYVISQVLVCEYDTFIRTNGKALGN